MPAAARAVDDKVRLWRGANPKLVHGSRKRSCFVTVGLNWEQHRSKPDAPARALLLAIERDPEVMRKLLVDMADRLAELLSPERGAACNAAACRVKILKSRHFLAKSPDLCFACPKGYGGECRGKGLGRRGMRVGMEKTPQAFEIAQNGDGNWRLLSRVNAARTGVQSPQGVEETTVSAAWLLDARFRGHDND
jgi:hypothetical protein